MLIWILSCLTENRLNSFSVVFCMKIGEQICSWNAFKNLFTCIELSLVDVAARLDVEIES